ncbi:MAG: hypothetical protein R2741_12445 [Methanolobus sp.]
MQAVKTRKKKSKEILDKVSQKAAGKTEHVEKISAIEFMMEEVEEGTIVGIIESKESYAIIVHNLSENHMVQILKECEERISTDILRAVMKIAFDISNTGREGKDWYGIYCR